MFVRVKKIGNYEYLYLVENAREGGRHVQRVVKALGRRDEVEASGLLDALVASAARHSRRSIVLSSFYRGELAELQRASIGADLVFGRLWQSTGYRDVIAALLAERGFDFDVERAIYLTVLHRLMVSGSDRHASRWREALRIPGVENLTLDQVYKAMRWLGEDIAGSGSGTEGRHTTDVIEEQLYRHRQELFGEVSVAFFDTTSLYFEGAGGQTLGHEGRSKDYRPHLKQIILGMVLDGSDRPFASFLWPGNPADVTRLAPVVERLRTRFGINKVCVVADRGMISAATIAALEQQNIDYILGARERSTTEIRKTVLEDDGVAVPLLIPRQKGALSSPSRTLPSVVGAMCSAATRRKPRRTLRPASQSSPVSSASSCKATRRWSATRATGASLRHRAMNISPSIPRVSPKTNALTACLCCASTPRCQPYRSRCAIAT